MRRISIPFVLPWLTLIIPLNIYVVGDWAAVGIQWALFRYQQSSMGSSIICLGNDVNHIFLGLLSAKTLASVGVWFVAVGLLLLSLIFLLKNLQTESSAPFKGTGRLILVSASLFLLADIIQYGVILFSKYSLCIPIGLPFLFIIGYWEYRYADAYYREKEAECVSPVISNPPAFSDFLTKIRESQIIQELALLILISVFVKFIVYSLSFYSPYEVDGDDIRLYYSYASMALAGQVPYLHFPVEYPQFFFIPVLIAALPMMIVNDLTIYSRIILVEMYLFDLVTLVCVYLIARKVLGDTKAFLSGLLYATSFSSVFFVPLSYDIFPTCCMLLAVTLFVYRHESVAYVSAAGGMLAKWFPVFCFPFFFLYSVKNREDLRPTITGWALASGIVLITVVPFLILNPEYFLKTYSMQIGRTSDPHSIIYYGDVFSGIFFHMPLFFSGISLLLLIFGECAIIIWYYRSLDEKQISMIAALSLSIIYFFIINKAGTPTFIIWFTPFLALILINSSREIFLFYLVQLLMYVEAPLLLGIVWIKGASRYQILENSMVTFPFVFYTVKYLILVSVMIYIVIRIHRQNCRNTDPSHIAE